MMKGWSILARRGSVRDDARPALAAAAGPAQVTTPDPRERPAPIFPDLPPPRTSPLDVTGEQTELVRVHVSHMMARLDEIKTLSEDFSRLRTPLDDFLVQYPKAQARMLDAEAALKRETEAARLLRRERDEALSARAAASDELAQAVATGSRQEAMLRDNEEALAELRTLMRETTARAEHIERQFYAEAERSQVLADESRILRQHAQSGDQTNLRLEQNLNEAHAQVHLLERENSRLQQATEDQSRKLAEASARCEELERKLEIALEANATLETNLNAEQARRDKAESDREADRTAHSVNAASLSLKVDGLTSRLATTTRTLAQMREQVREKMDALQAAERAVSEARIETNAAQRKLSVAQEEARRFQDAVQETQSAKESAEERGEMLTKALSAKSAHLDGANGKIEALTERLEQLSQRFEQERAALEATNRKLSEALQGEKAERTLAQGALTIARESRSKLQTQFANLRRRAEMDPPEAGGESQKEAPGADEQTPAPETNVRVFPPAENPQPSSS
jgi:crescentin